MDLTPTKDLYAVLGISPLANRETIRSAHRALALQYHPDRTNGDLEKTEKFKSVQDAYDTLSDTKKKYSYDLAQSRPTFSVKPPPTPAADAFIWDGWNANFSGRKYNTPPATPFSSTFPTSKRHTCSPPVTPTKTKSPFAATGSVSKKDSFDDAGVIRPIATPTAPKRQTKIVYISSDDEKDEVPSPGSGNGEPRADPCSPKSPTPSRHYTFFDYYDTDYNEKPFLQKLRQNVETNKEKWRLSCKTASQAKVELMYAKRKDKPELQQAYDAKRSTRDSRQRWKKLQEAKLKAHLKRAREVKAARKKIDRQIEEQNKKRKRIFEQQERLRKAAEKMMKSGEKRKKRNGKNCQNHQDDESDEEWRMGD